MSGSAAFAIYRKSHSAYLDILKGPRGDETLFKLFRDKPGNRFGNIEIAGFGEFLAEMKKEIYGIRRDRAGISAAAIDGITDMKGESVFDRRVVCILFS